MMALKRVSEPRRMAREVFAYIYADATYRAKHKLTIASQGRIESLVKETLRVGRLIEMAAAGEWGFGPSGFAVIRACVKALNKRFGDYPSIVEIQFAPEHPKLVHFNEYMAATPGRPAMEARMARLIFSLAEHAWILQVRECARKGCNRLFFSWREGDSYCSEACRHSHWEQIPERRAIRAAKAKAHYHDERKRDMKARGERAKAGHHARESAKAWAHHAYLSAPKGWKLLGFASQKNTEQ